MVRGGELFDYHQIDCYAIVMKVPDNGTKQ